MRRTRGSPEPLSSQIPGPAGQRWKYLGDAHRGQDVDRGKGDSLSSRERGSTLDPQSQSRLRKQGTAARTIWKRGGGRGGQVGVAFAAVVVFAVAPAAAAVVPPAALCLGACSSMD